jgi:hypothetical protein
LANWLISKKGPIAYRRPETRGPVAPAHLDAFSTMIPELAGRLSGIIPWADKCGVRSAHPALANDIASRALGISVDLRIGGLVTRSGIRRAIFRAAGDCWQGGGRTQYRRLAPFVVAKVPTVAPDAAFRNVNGLAGAAWSCVVDTVLNERKAWDGTRDAHGNLLWASDKYLPPAGWDTAFWMVQSPATSAIH